MACITLSMPNSSQYLEGLKNWMSPVRDLVRPVSEGYFAGTLDFSKLPLLNVLAMSLRRLIGMWKRAITATGMPCALGREPAPTSSLGFSMDRRWYYEIRIEANLADHWSELFEGLTIQIEPHGGETD